MTRNAEKLHEMNAEVRFSNRLKLWDYQLANGLRYIDYQNQW